MIPEYLPKDDLIAYLCSTEGKGIEQWLTHQESNGFRFIKWVRIVKEVGKHGTEWCVYEKISLDVGGVDCIDMDEFEDIGDPDEPEGKRSVHQSSESAVAYAETIGADRGKFVVVGGIQYIYLNFIEEYGLPQKSAADWFSNL